MARVEHPWKNAPGAPVDHQDDYWGFADATGIVTGYVQVRHGEGWYPPMIEIGVDDGSLLSDDARALGRALIEAADRCDQLPPAPPPQGEDG